VTEAETRFTRALRAVVWLAEDMGVGAGVVSGALIALAAETSAKAIGLDGSADALADGAVEGMRAAAERLGASKSIAARRAS
jgi:hypothetical protein